MYNAYTRCVVKCSLVYCFYSEVESIKDNQGSSIFFSSEPCSLSSKKAHTYNKILEFQIKRYQTKYLRWVYFWPLITNIASDFWYSSDLCLKSQILASKESQLTFDLKNRTKFQKKKILGRWLRTSDQNFESIFDLSSKCQILDPNWAKLNWLESRTK